MIFVMPYTRPVVWKKYAAFYKWYNMGMFLKLMFAAYRIYVLLLPCWKLVCKPKQIDS